MHTYTVPVGVSRIFTPESPSRNSLIGAHVYGSWRRRLEKANGNYGYVAGQMKKASIPVELARAILFT